MNKQAGKPIVAAMAMASVVVLAGCAGMTGSSSSSNQPVYRCDQGLQFTVRFVNDTAMLNGARGDDVLLRDAGGQGTQTVYTNPRLRAEFGLGSSGREALLQYLPPAPVALRCRSD